MILSIQFLFVTNKIESILKYFKLTNAKLHLKFNKNLFYKYIDKYLDNAFLAGGCFSSYNSNNIFANKFFELKKICIENQDFDIFMVDKLNVKFQYFCDKFKNFDGFNKTSMSDYQNISANMTINTIKVKLDNTFVNLIFINVFNYNKKTFRGYNDIDTFIHFIFKFDFNLTRIFYSFKLKKTFMYIGLFSLFDSFEEKSCSQKFLKDFENKVVGKSCSTAQQFSNLEYQYKKIKSIIKIVKNYVDIEKILNNTSSFKSKFECLTRLIPCLPAEIYIKHKIDDPIRNFVIDHQYIVFDINRSLERRNLKRFFKYLIKGSYIPENQLELFNKLDFFLEVFNDFIKMAIDNKREFDMEIYFECLIKFLLF